ncbi:DUF4367 domain-containing protein [Paenibacillus soyae]|uniref:DUF4367 domain-containing protein n=1 Tax=Paenibacillus soyae TaxID=2969249 RepID=A0A9X2MU50_9BACL|nr:DUF4367 domain-containing protein [Paenibacillus soyae]MCR2806535.1 DUF4367 domain-containing protein [Paenibacillus soyae]
MNKEEFDEWFDHAFEESVKDHNFVPDASASWERVQKQINRRNRRRKQLRTLPYVAASFLLGALIFGTPTATDAFKPFFRAYNTVVEGVNKIVFGSQQPSDVVPKTLPPPDYQGGTSGAPAASGGTSNKLSVTDPSELPDLEFEKPSIPYIPEEFVLTHIRTMKTLPDQYKYNLVRYAYTRDDGMILSIEVVKLPPGAIISSGGSTEGVVRKQLTVHGAEAFLYLGDDGWSSLEYMRNDIYVKIGGPVDEETIVRIANEMTIKD